MAIPVYDIPQLDLELDELDAFEPDYSSQSNYYTSEDYHRLTCNRLHSENFTIMNVNSRSLIKNISDYELLFQSFKSDKYFGFDILTFTETWLDDNLQHLISFDDYNAIFKHKVGKKEGGGIAIFVRDNINFIHRTDLSFTHSKQNLFDCLFIEISSSKLTKNIILGVLYRSPSHDSTTDFTLSLMELLDSISHENKEVILMGDTNIDLMKYKSHKIISDYLDALMSNNLYPIITKPTRVSQTTSTLIDHIFAKKSDLQYLGGTLINDISDHYINFVSIFPQKKCVQKVKTVTYRSLCEQNVNKMNDDLLAHNWNNVLNISDPCLAYNEFINTYNHYLDKNIPVKCVKFNRYKHRKESWMSKGLLKSIRIKDKLYQNFKYENNPLRKRNLEIKYKTYRNKLNTLIRSAKKMHWEKLFRTSEKDTKTTWKNINLLLNRTSENSKTPEEIKWGNRSYNGPVNVVNALNDFFTNIGSSLADNIPNSQTDPKTYLPQVNFVNSFTLIPTTPEEVSKILKNMKPKSSSSHDKISPKLAKLTQEGITIPLVHIINLSLQTGQIPNNMKLAQVVPIFKNGEKNLIQNYRPISLLPTFSKLLERIVYNRLYKYLVINKVLTPCQYGFQKHKSTELAILELLDNLVTSMSNGNHCFGIFLDLSKAFDTLNHALLLSKLEHYGIRGLAHTWFKNYLTDRRQFTSVNGFDSGVSAVTCGVPQGSILGPLLFLIYINDLVNVSNIGNMILFADDTNLIYENSNLTELISIVNTDLEKVTDWFRINKLSLNVEKTKFISFRKKPSSETISDNLMISGTNIKQVKKISFLGVLIQENLKWNEHITLKSNKISKINSLLYRLKNTVPERTLINIYNALIVPHLSYGITAWGDAPQSLLKRLITLQKKALRTITGSKYNSHTEPIFKKLNLLKLKDLYKVNCCKLHYRSKINTLPHSHVHNLPTVGEINPYSSRSSSDIYIRTISQNIQKQTLNHKIGTMWNSLPTHLKEISNITLPTFSKKLKTHLLSLYSLSCTEINCFSCNSGQVR